MGSSRLVTAKVTSPPESSQQTADLRHHSAVSSQQPGASSSHEQRPQIRVLGQYSHHQNCRHHDGQRGGGAPAAAAAESEASAVERGADPGAGHQPPAQGGTLQVPEPGQGSLLLLPAPVQPHHPAPPLLAPAAEGRVQGGQQQQQQPGQQQQQHQLLARWWRPQRVETGQIPPVPQPPAHLGVRSPVISMQMQSNKCINCYLSTCNKINVE